MTAYETVPARIGTSSRQRICRHHDRICRERSEALPILIPASSLESRRSTWRRVWLTLFLIGTCS